MKMIAQIVKDMKIRSKLLAAFLLFSAVLTIAISVMSYKIYTDTVSKKIETYAGYLMSQLCDNIYRELNKNIDKLTIILSDEPMSRQYPIYRKLDSKAQYELILKMNRNVCKNLVSSENVKAAGYMTFWNDFYIPLWNYSLDELSDENVPKIALAVCRVSNDPPLRQIVQNLQQENVQMQAEYVTLGNQDAGGILIAKKYRYPPATKDSIFFTILDEKAFSSIFENIELGKGETGDRSEIFIVNSKGIVQASNSARLEVGKPLPDAAVRELLTSNTTSAKFSANSVPTEIGECLISAAKVGSDNTSDWFAVGMIPRSYMQGETTAIVIALFISCLIFIGLAFLISFTLSRGIANPIVLLNQKMKEVEKGKLDVAGIADRNDEIGELHKRFSKMTAEIRNLLREKDDANEKSRELELEMLEYQINPHFLYNTFDSINWIARANGQHDISKLVTSLAKFYRIGLSKGSKFIFVRDELEHVRSYLYINKIRFKDSFDFFIEADEGALSYRTLKALLQPVVENSIKYGINKDDSVGFIQIRCSLADDVLCFEVSDNGAGIKAEALAQIRENLKDAVQNHQSENGFGLINVDQRIKLRFGQSYGVSIFSEGIHKGTLVRITLPIQK